MRFASLVGALSLTLALAGCEQKVPQRVVPRGDTSGPIYTTTDLGRDFLAVVINPQHVASPDEYPALARQACAEREICVVGMWDHPRKQAVGLPMSRQQTIEQVFSYGINRQTGREILNWNCELLPQYRDRGCIPWPMQPSGRPP
ncbi:MAG: hypothetical protein IT535_04605 [Bauldia sp.]|nr:hypothetical protein [Bauldia sp.]